MKRLLLLVLVLTLTLSGCSFWDEMKGLSVFSDFVFTFQKKWNEENGTGAWLKESSEENNRQVYSTTVEGLQGKVGTYTGDVDVTYITYTHEDGKTRTYFFFNADLSVTDSSGKTALSKATTLKIDACCLSSSGLILDGIAVTKNNDDTTVAIYMQAANLEGLYIKLGEVSSQSVASTPTEGNASANENGNENSGETETVNE